MTRRFALFLPALAALAAAPAPKAKDPVCGMEVDTTKAKTLTKDGKAYYFCSDHCKREFEKNPQKYLAPKKAA